MRGLIRHALAQAERMADALLIGSVGGGELWARAQREYMRRQPRPYMKLVAAVMERDLAGRVVFQACFSNACACRHARAPDMLLGACCIPGGSIVR